MTPKPRLSKTERALQARLEARSSAAPCDETRRSVLAAAEKRLEEPGVLVRRARRPVRRFVLAGAFGGAVVLLAGLAWLAAQSDASDSRNGGAPHVAGTAATPETAPVADAAAPRLEEVDARLAQTRARLARAQEGRTLDPVNRRPGVSRLVRRARRLRAALGENGDAV